MFHIFRPVNIWIGTGCSRCSDGRHPFGISQCIRSGRYCCNILRNRLSAFVCKRIWCAEVKNLFRTLDDGILIVDRPAVYASIGLCLEKSCQQDADKRRNMICRCHNVSFLSLVCSCVTCSFADSGTDVYVFSDDVRPVRFTDST